MTQLTRMPAGRRCAQHGGRRFLCCASPVACFRLFDTRLGSGPAAPTWTSN